MCIRVCMYVCAHTHIHVQERTDCYTESYKYQNKDGMCTPTIRVTGDASRASSSWHASVMAAVVTPVLMYLGYD